MEARAASFTVTTGGDGPGVCLTGNCTTLRGAIAAAVSGDTIAVATGVPSIALSGSLIIDKDLTLTSPLPGNVYIDGDQTSTVLVFTAGASTIQGFLIDKGASTGGAACPNGGVCAGGIYIESGASLTMIDTFVMNNNANGSYGGGIFNRGLLRAREVMIMNNSANAGYGGGLYNVGTAAFTNSHFENNKADAGYGGAIFNGGYNSGTATLDLTGCVITNNGVMDGYGAGIYNGGLNNATGDSLLTISNSTISSNFILHSGYGGGLYSGGYMNGVGKSVVTISNSTFNGNFVGDREFIDGIEGLDLMAGGYGGAIFNGSFSSSRTTTQMVISNSTFNGNQTPNGHGAAICNGSISGATPSLAIANSTFSGNSAIQGTGGAIYNNTLGNLSAGTVKMGSTIVTGNTADSGPNIDGVITSLGNNLVGDTSGASSTSFMQGAHADQTGVSLSSMQLGGLTDNGGPTFTMALLGSGNPAVGKGFCTWDSTVPVPAVSTDQRGTVRAAPCDVGAFELSVAQSASGGGGCSIGHTDPRKGGAEALALTALAIVAAVTRRPSRLSFRRYRGKGLPSRAGGRRRSCGCRRCRWTNRRSSRARWPAARRG
jgi:hypothetical protein